MEETVGAGPLTREHEEEGSEVVAELACFGRENLMKLVESMIGKALSFLGRL